MKIQKQFVDMKSFALLIVAVGFLASSASVSATTNFNLLYGADRQVLQLDKSTLFKKEINISQDKITLEISEANNKTIENALVYLCKNLKPSDCANTKPIKYRRTVNTDFLKTDVLENSTGKIILFLELSDFLDNSPQKKNWWIADLISIDSGQVLDVNNYEIDVDLTVNLNDTKSTLSKTGMIPYNFFNSIQFKGKSFYQISGAEKEEQFLGKKSLNFSHNKLENSLQKIDGYSFIFPVDQNILSPITVYNIKESCGDAVCGLGENYNICWSDCRCPSGYLPGSKGCSNEIIRIVVDSAPETVECIGDEEVCRVFSSNYSIKIHLENAPVDYRLNEQYFKLGNKFISGQPLCFPDSGFKTQKLDNGNLISIYNATNFSCSLPEHNLKKEEIGSLVFSIYFSISYNTQNGTEFKEAVGQTTLNFKDILAESRTKLLSLQKKLEKNRKLPMDVRHVLEGVKAIGITMDAIAAGTCACCVVWFCSWGAACPVCVKTATDAIIIEGIRQVLTLGFSECTGVYKPQVFGVPLGDAEEIKGGTGRSLASQISPTCRRIERAQDDMRQTVAEASQKQQIALNELVSNLVWVNGENSGIATGSLCSKEKTEIYYTFEEFECNKDLWFNLNSAEKPACDCNNRNFTKYTPLGDSCNCFENTSSYTWTIDNSTGNPFGRQKYNTTNFHILYNSTADLLFRNSNQINITLYCDSDRYGKIVDTLPLATYKPTCDQNVNERGVNIFDPNSLLSGVSVI